MEDSSWGYSEIPPGSGGNAAERERKRLAEKSEGKYPPAERPLYSPLPEPEPLEDELPEQRPSGTALSLTSLVIGIVALVLAAVFFYRSNVNIKSAEIHAQQALTAVDELKHSGSPAPAALKIELMRTTRTLDAMTVEFQVEPEALSKIERLRSEVNEILAMLDEKTPEAAPAEEAAAPAEAPAAAMPEAAVAPPAPAAKQPSPPPAK
ncbi:MAG: hypothetical protein HZA03_05295 [Nitrospinae bacterium]|nr:hypothetical protein [Nitrospinota bacterium]